MNSHVHQPTLLVADADADLRRSVAGFMSARGYLVEHTNSGQKAADVLVSRAIDVLITDLAVAEKSGLELLAFARESAPSTRSIVIGNEPTGRDREGATRLGAVRVLAKPVSLLELADAVAVASDCGDGFHGWLHRLSLVDVLQMFHLSGQSLTLFLRGSSEGKIYLRAGQIVHAEFASMVGEPALVEMLRERRGTLESAPLDHLGTSISGSFEHVLLNSIRFLDEEKRRSSRPGTRSPSKDSWAFDLQEPSECQLLSRWFDAHAPGAHAWLLDATTAGLTQIVGENSAIALAVDEQQLAACLARAEGVDPTFRRMELTIGDLNVAFLRRPERTLLFARVANGEEALRKFRFEVTQLSRFWVSEVEHA